jgi:hypothetical protein
MVDLDLLDAGTVDSRLVRWGKWKMRSGVALGYPKQAAFMNLSGVRRDPVLCADEIDSECVLTDRIVESLPLVHQTIVRVEYVIAYRESAAKAHACGVCKRSYYNYLNEAKRLFAESLNKSLRDVHSFDINAVSCRSVSLAN